MIRKHTSNKRFFLKIIFTTIFTLLSFQVFPFLNKINVNAATQVDFGFDSIFTQAVVATHSPTPIPPKIGYKVYSFKWDGSNWQQTTPFAVGISKSTGLIVTPGSTTNFNVINQSIPTLNTSEYYAFALLYGGVIRNSPSSPYRKMLYADKIEYVTVRRVRPNAYEFGYVNVPPGGIDPMPPYSTNPSPSVGDLPLLPWPQVPYPGE